MDTFSLGKPPNYVSFGGDFDLCKLWTKIVSATFQTCIYRYTLLFIFFHASPSHFHNIFAHIALYQRMRKSGALMTALMVAAMLLSTCCLATSRISLHDQTRRSVQEDQTAETGYYNEAFANGRGSLSSVNNHHYIPRQDFNNYASSGGTKGAGGDNGEIGSDQTTN